MNKVTTRTATIEMDENEIVIITILNNVEIDEEDALDNMLVVRNLTNGKKALKLVDSRAAFIINKKAQKFMLGKEEIKEKTIARAILKNSLLSKWMLEFFVNMNKPEVPTRIFTEYKEAYAWLLSNKT